MKSRKIQLNEKTKDFLQSMCFLSPSLLGVAVFFIVRSIKKDIERAKQEQSLRNNMRKKPRR